jgi:hypothetical protein
MTPLAARLRWTLAIGLALTKPAALEIAGAVDADLRGRATKPLARLPRC